MLKKVLAVMAVALLLPAIAAAQKFGTIEQRGNAAPKADGRTAAPFGMPEA